MKLYKRKIFAEIERYIGDETVIVLHGARQVGKTYILYFIRDWLIQNNKKVFYYDLELPNLLDVLNFGVQSFVTDIADKGYVEGEEIYILIDEIQYLDNPSSFLKIIADHYKNVHLIVSGSSTFDIKSKFKDSLVGRTTSFEIYPLCFSEYLEFKESQYKTAMVSTQSGTNDMKELYREFIKYGAYPKIAMETDEEKKKKYLLQVIDTYIRKDIRDLADITDVRKFNGMLKILASQSGQLLDMASLSRETTISFRTLRKYLDILEETYVIKIIPPYSKNQSVEISKNPKVFFYDSGIQSVLWFGDFNNTLLWSVFETNVFGELVKKYGRQAVHFWRTKTRQEIDFVIERDGGVVLPIEVKTNFRQFNPRAMNSFIKKYKIRDWKLISLEGEKLSPNEFFPWEI